jgi:cytoskeletal protein CcmA (bactofilin family)
MSLINNPNIIGDISINNDLYISGSINPNSTSSFYDINVTNNLDVAGDLSTNRLFVNGVSITNNNQNSTGDLTANKLVVNDVSINNNLDVSENLTANNLIVNDVNINNNLDVAGDLSTNRLFVNGVSITNNNQNSTGDLTVGKLVVDDVSINNNLDVAGDLSTNRLFVNDVSTTRLFVNGVSITNNNQNSTANLTANKLIVDDVSINNNLDVEGVLTANNLVVNDVSINNNLDVSENLTANKLIVDDVSINNNLDVEGVLTANNMFVNDVSINNNLDVEGVLTANNLVVNDVSINNNLDVSENLTANNLVVNDVSINNNLDVEGVLTANKLIVDDVSINNNLDVSENLTANNLVVNDVSINNNLDVSENLTANNLIVNDVSINNNLDVSENLTANKLIVDDVSINNNLDVIGDTSINDLYVGGIGEFNKGAKYKNMDICDNDISLNLNIGYDQFKNIFIQSDQNICISSTNAIAPLIEFYTKEKDANGDDIPDSSRNVIINTDLVVLERTKTTQLYSLDSINIGETQIVQTTDLTGETFDDEIPVWRILNNDNDNNRLEFQYRTGNNMTVTAYMEQKNTSKLLNFTGQHRTLFKQKHNYLYSLVGSGVLKGFIVSSTGNYIHNSIEINESIPYIQLSTMSKDPSCYGVLSDIENKNETREINVSSIVTINDKVNDIDHRVIVNSLGEGAIWVCNYNGNINNGDYITTSPIPGIGMCQSEEYLSKYTIAKSTCDCSFNTEQIYIEDFSKNPVYIPGTQIQQKYSSGRLMYDPIYDANGEVIYYNMRDSNGIEIKENKFSEKILEVFEDKYIIYEDDTKQNIFLTYNFDFMNGKSDQQSLIGTTVKIAFIGVIYCF